MRVAVVSNDKEIDSVLTGKGLTITDHDPEYVISYGGDGTFLSSENKHPEVPKLVLKNSRVCKLCSKEDNDEILNKFIRGRFRIQELIKLEAKFQDKNLKAINDITIHNSDPRHAIRYMVRINGEKIHEQEVIGDGVVIATPKLGATGYYRSITDSFFNVGIGLAFNNSTEAFDHMVLEEDTKIEIEIIRGPAKVYADNQEDFIELNDGDSILIKKSEEKGRILRFLNN